MRTLSLSLVNLVKKNQLAKCRNKKFSSLCFMSTRICSASRVTTPMAWCYRFKHLTCDSPVNSKKSTITLSSFNQRCDGWWYFSPMFSAINFTFPSTVSQLDWTGKKSCRDICLLKLRNERSLEESEMNGKGYSFIMCLRVQDYVNLEFYHQTKGLHNSVVHFTRSLLHQCPKVPWRKPNVFQFLYSAFV